MIPNRLKRVNHLIQHEISRILLEEIKDPRVGFATVTEVDTAADLRNARVYVSILDEEDKQNAGIEALKSAAKFMRARLRENIELRHIPQLIFHLDHSIERGVRVSRLIDQLAAEIPRDDIESE